MGQRSFLLAGPRKLLVLMLVLELGGICWGKWEEPFEIHADDNPVPWVSTYTDNQTSKTHIVFKSFDDNEEEYYNYYLKMAQNNDKSEPILLANMPTTPDILEPSITGANDGKNLFVAMILRRTEDRVTDDLYFSESNSEGVSWTTPIVARGNDVQDTTDRDSPVLLYIKPGKLFLFFRRNDTLAFVTRTRFSTVWSQEKDIAIQRCEADSFVVAATLTYESEHNATVHFSTVCYQPEAAPVLYIGRSSDNGGTWQIFGRNLTTVPEPLSTLVTNGNRSLMVGSTIQYGISKRRWDLSTLYFFHESGTWIPIASFPLQTSEYHLQSLQLCTLNSQTQIVYFATPLDKANNQTAILWQVPVYEPWMMNLLPPPRIAADAQLICRDNQLLVIGTDGNRKVLAQRYKFVAEH